MRIVLYHWTHESSRHHSWCYYCGELMLELVIGSASFRSIMVSLFVFHLLFSLCPANRNIYFNNENRGIIPLVICVTRSFPSTTLVQHRFQFDLFPDYDALYLKPEHDFIIVSIFFFPVLCLFSISWLLAILFHLFANDLNFWSDQRFYNDFICINAWKGLFQSPLIMNRKKYVFFCQKYS